jgi:hypothetical protein
MAAGGYLTSEGSSGGTPVTVNARDERANGMPPGRERTQLDRHRRTLAVMSLTRSSRAQSMKFVTSDEPP